MRSGVTRDAQMFELENEFVIGRSITATHICKYPGFELRRSKAFGIVSICCPMVIEGRCAFAIQGVNIHSLRVLVVSKTKIFCRLFLIFINTIVTSYFTFVAHITRAASANSIAYTLGSLKRYPSIGFIFIYKVSLRTRGLLLVVIC